MRRVWTSFVALALSIGLAAEARGQADLASHRPRFLAANSVAGERGDASNAAVLRRRVTLALTAAMVEDALKEIARQANLELMFTKAVLPPDRPVTLHASDITVGAALTQVLWDTGLDVLLLPGGQMGLVRRSAPEPVRAASGTVSGRVTDARTGQGLVGADVLLERTKWRATAGEDGRYRIGEVDPGSYTLSVRRIGYAKRTQAVNVVSGAEATADVALEPVPTQLNEVVTTVTGDQRRLELGHVVGVINADSLVKEAPITTLSDLLTARVPGLQVFQSQGTVGGDVRLQIRGKNSFLLNTEPIVIIDGVRYSSSAVSGARFAERVTPLNDINPNDLESIEVVKGPSAATLYGTDAANGVLVITTKRGRPGPARWSVYGKAGTTALPTIRYLDGYAGWGRTTSGNTTPFCTLHRSVTLGSCTQDSVRVVPNPLNDPAWTIFGREPQWSSGANVAGGREDLRYYFSADYEKAIGPLRMPPIISDQLAQRRGVSKVPEEQLKPNALNKINLRTNITAKLAEKVELRATFGYVHSDTRSLGMGTASAYEWGISTARPTDPYGTDGGDPASSFSRLATEGTDRFLATLGGQWRPAPWLLTRGTVGLDLGNRNWYSLLRAGDSPIDLPTGYVGEDRTRQLATTADLGATATARRGRLSARTSIGAQYVRSLSNTLNAFGLGLPPGGTSIGNADRVVTRQTYGETITLGTYLEEALGFSERLFVTGALRVDGASAFGQNYSATVYPKTSLSWLVSDEPFMPRVQGLDELRLRYAYGASGQQPQPGWALPSYTTSHVASDAGDVTTVELTGLGNSHLRPERVREHEFGVDLTGLGNHLQVGLTWYKRRTVDQIVSVQLPAGLGSTYSNLGLTTQHGFELNVAAHVLDTRAVSLDVMAQHSIQRTHLVDIGSATPVYSYAGSLVSGYSLGARFQPQILSYHDANGDGILVPSEVQLTPEPVYVGESTPPVSQSLTAALGMFGRHLRLSALVERRTGFLQEDRLKQGQCQNSRCREAFDPTAPLADQAEFVFLNLTAQHVPSTYLRPGDFTRLRELALALDLPVSFAHVMRVSSATLTIAGRNVALWTAYPGPDPESGNVSREPGLVTAAIPQSRSWSVRLDLGF